MHDRPTATELLGAVRHFLEKELPAHVEDPRLRYRALVAAHVLWIVERQQALEERHLVEEWHQLAALLDWKGAAPATRDTLRESVLAGNQQLCERIRLGDYDSHDAFLALVRHLRPFVARKLEVAAPSPAEPLRKTSPGSPTH